MPSNHLPKARDPVAHIRDLLDQLPVDMALPDSIRYGDLLTARPSLGPLSLATGAHLCHPISLHRMANFAFFFANRP